MGTDRRLVGIVVLFVCSFGLAQTGCATAMADQGDSAAVVAGGTLSISVGSNTELVVSTDGHSVATKDGGASPWTVTDARGTGQPWSVVLSASDFISAPGNEENTARTVDISNLSIGSGPIAAGNGSDPAPAAVSMTLSRSSQTFVTSSLEAKGNYTFTPVLAFTRPADIQPPNHKIGNSGKINPYISTLTVTIG